MFIWLHVAQGCKGSWSGVETVEQERPRSCFKPIICTHEGLGGSEFPLLRVPWKLSPSKGKIGEVVLYWRVACVAWRYLVAYSPDTLPIFLVFEAQHLDIISFESQHTIFFLLCPDTLDLLPSYFSSKKLPENLPLNLSFPPLHLITAYQHYLQPAIYPT